MFEDILKLTLTEADGDRAYSDLVDRWTIDRWFSFSGMLKSCQYSVDKMKEYGFDEAKVEKFPADGITMFGYWRMPYAWDPTDAKLTIIAPDSHSGRVLAHYKSLPCGLTMWSPPTPAKGVEGEVVAFDRGSHDADYKGVNVKGKFILTNLRGSSVRTQAIKRGAIGVISDECRHPYEMPDAVDWMNAWSDDPSGWGLTRGEKNIIGFNISHRQGCELRELIRKNGSVRLHAVVDAKVYKGVMPAATGAIKGSTNEEVITLGHGAEQGANDNSSGCACMLEALRILKTLINAGKLKKPKRGIRMLITWEVYATLAFVEAHKKRFDRTVAGLCLDMVGEKQKVIDAPLGVHRGPESNASFSDSLIRLIAQSVFTKRWPAYRWIMAKYGLTDSVIGEPSIGVPTAYLGQGGGGDRNWHTNEDTPDKADPKALKHIAGLTATYLYFLANAGEEEALWLARASSADHKAKLASAGFEFSDALAEASSARELTELLEEQCESIDYLHVVAENAIESVRKLVTKPTRRFDDALLEIQMLTDEAVCGEFRSLEAAAEQIASKKRWKLVDVEPKIPAEIRQAARMIVQQTKIGPIVFDGIPLSKRKDVEDGRWGGNGLDTTLNWCDGTRTLDEAIWLASRQLGKELTGIVKQMKKCEKLGLVRIRKT